MPRTMTAFLRSVQLLKASRATVTVCESSAGGLINAGILAVPGASAVYWGGSVVYSTQRASQLMLLDETDARALRSRTITTPEDYEQSKIAWTSLAARSLMRRLGTTWAIAEGGAAGPTFNYGVTQGFSVVTVCARPQREGDEPREWQRLWHTGQVDRVVNMRAFAESAADFFAETLEADARAHPR